MPGVEADDEAYFNERVEATGGETRKVKWLGRRGAPDRLVGWKGHGRYAFVELKHPDQPWGLQDHQEREISRMRSWGLHVEVLCGRAEIDRFIIQMTGWRG